MMIGDTGPTIDARLLKRTWVYLWIATMMLLSSFAFMYFLHVRLLEFEDMSRSQEVDIHKLDKLIHQDREQRAST